LYGKGDLNGDKAVDTKDIALMTAYLATPPEPMTPKYDINADNVVNEDDLRQLMGNVESGTAQPLPAISFTDSLVSAKDAKPEVHKLTVALNVPAVVAGFTLGYDKDVVTFCDPAGAPLAGHNDLVEGAGYKVYEQTNGSGVRSADFRTIGTVETPAGTVLAELYYTCVQGKSTADFCNGTFHATKAYGGFTDTFGRLGLEPTNTMTAACTYPNSTKQTLAVLTLTGESSAKIPVSGTAECVVTLSGADKSGLPFLPEGCTWEMTPLTGVTLEGTGNPRKVVVSAGTAPGKVTITVTDPATKLKTTKEIAITKAPSVANRLVVGGPPSITMDEGKEARATYTATVYDQYGAAMDVTEKLTVNKLPYGARVEKRTIVFTESMRPGTYQVIVTGSYENLKDSLSTTITVISNTPTPTPTLPPTPPPKPTPTPSPKPTPGGGGGVVPPVPEVDADVPAETLKESPAITVTPKAVAGAGGVYTATLTPDELAAINLAMTGSRGAVVIAPQVGADATGVAVTLPKTAVSALSTRGGRGMELRSSLGTISLNCGALTAAAAAAGENFTVSASAVGGDKSILKVEMMAGDNSLQSLAGGVTLTAPVPAALGTTGLVAVLVAADGTETVVRKSAAVNGNMVVPLSGGATVKLKSVPSPFTDMDGHWAADSAAFTSARGLFTGITPATFVPGDDMTRGMVVTVLHRLEDLPHAGQPAVFQDVASDAWYTDAVSWAADSGIVQGSGGGFLPGDNVSREQLATMLYRYAKQQKLSVAGQKNLAKFPDGTDVSSWSQDAMSWAVAAGLFAGGSDGRLNPGGTASRAEVAIILERFVTFAAKER
ncbi:MAG: S-layer homology domain-containing protein, partial [Oscillospiraceae bacterium]